MSPMAANHAPAPPVICEACGTANTLPPRNQPQRTLVCSGCGRPVSIRLAQQTFTRSPRSEESR